MDTRSRILATAMELFLIKGFHGTTLADILGHARLNSGSLYNCFAGKQDLLIAVLQAYHDDIRPSLLDPVWTGIDDPIEKIFALLGRYRAALDATHCAYGCPIGSLALELHEPEPAVRELLAANLAAWVGAVEECLAQANDRLPESLDRQALAEFVLTTMEGGVMQARTHRDIGHFDRSVAVLREHFILLENTVRNSQPLENRP